MSSVSASNGSAPDSSATNGWHYAVGDKAVGPLNVGEMETVLSSTTDPRNLMVWRPGLKHWVRAGDVQMLSELISVPPPLPRIKPQRKSWAERGVWRSVVAIGVALAVYWVGSGYLIQAPLAALPVLIGLDWATRRRRQFADQIINRKLRWMELAEEQKRLVDRATGYSETAEKTR